ncbi:MAG: hypothetical protein RL095_2887 [Verrucomicrobiota bacterium]|jgi:hypothetical protein
MSTTIDPNLLQAIQDSSEAFRALDTLIEDTCAAFDRGEDSQAFEGVSQIAQGLGAFLGFLGAVCAQIDSFQQVDADTFNSIRQNFEAAVMGFNQCLEKRDVAGAADALRYDIRDCLKDFSFLFRQIATTNS